MKQLFCVRILSCNSYLNAAAFLEIREPSIMLFSFSLGSKREILANLANFAYDPINYDYFRQLNIPDIFLGNALTLVVCYIRCIVLSIALCWL